MDRGPKPASPVPWRCEPDGDINSFGFRVVDQETAHRYRAMRTSARVRYLALVDCVENAATIVHRVNNWDALCDENDELRATCEDLHAWPQRHAEVARDRNGLMARVRQLASGYEAEAKVRPRHEQARQYLERVARELLEALEGAGQAVADHARTKLDPDGEKE